jgi:hypothetical protein
VFIGSIFGVVCMVLTICLSVLGIYALVLVIKALRTYIKKNS